MGGRTETHIKVHVKSVILRPTPLFYPYVLLHPFMSYPSVQHCSASVSTPYFCFLLLPYPLLQCSNLCWGELGFCWRELEFCVWMTLINHCKQQQSTCKKSVVVYMLSNVGSSNVSKSCLGTLEKEVEVAEVLAPSSRASSSCNFPLQILVRCRFRYRWKTTCWFGLACRLLFM